MPKFNHDLIGKFIMVSSPKRQVIEKFTRAQKGEKFYMPTWDINELYECHASLCEEIIKVIDCNLIKKKSLNCMEGYRMTPIKIEAIIRGAFSDNNLKGMINSHNNEKFK
jgi:hypothetical protein